MQRKITKQSRGANKDERNHMRWIKERMICAACDSHAPVINHHMYGATAKIKVDLITVLIGHSAVLGLCISCDNLITRRSRRVFSDEFGPQNKLWERQYSFSPIRFPDEVVRGIMAYE